MASAAELPAWLPGAWSRSYIRLATSDDTLGDPCTSVTVRYLQTLAGGHAFYLRVPPGYSSTGSRGIGDLSSDELQALAVSGVEAIAGVTTCEPSTDRASILRRHAAFTFPPLLGDADAPEAVLASIAEGTHDTNNVCVAEPSMPASRREQVARWLDHALDSSYEEEWLRLPGYVSRGAHLAAIRPATAGSDEVGVSGVGGARWLAIMGSTFAFARDIDRMAMPDCARNRPLTEALADENITLEAKRRLLDCEFSFGTFGQGGGVGGVVELSSAPWREGTALATLIAEAPDGWVPIRASDDTVLRQALAAVAADHEKACQSLREAEANGHEGVAEVLRSRGAVV